VNVEYPIVLKCYACDAPILMSDARYRALLQSKQDFWCSNGHKQHFLGETEDQKRIRQLEEQLRFTQRRLSEEPEDASYFRCCHPRCRFRHKARRVVLMHMRDCERAEKPKRLPAKAGPDALNTRVH
jgi:3-hydroxy-3-methylglutaryl CoA synthase